MANGYYLPIHAIVYGGGKFVAGGDAGRMAYSLNGITWTSLNTSWTPYTDFGIYTIAYGGGKFVYGATSGKMGYSSDGEAWTAVSNSRFGSNNNVRAIAYGGGRFVIVGYGGKIAYSNIIQ